MSFPVRDSLRDLELLIRARYGLIHLDTPEDARAQVLLHHLSDRLGVPFFVWTRLEGLRRWELPDPVYDTRPLARAVGHVTQARTDGVYHLQGVTRSDLVDPDVQALLREVARCMEGPVGAVVLTGQDLELPERIRPHSARLGLPGPGPQEFRELLETILRDLSARRHVEVSLTPDETDQLLRHLSGFTLLEAEKTLTRAIVEDGKLTLQAIGHVVDAKREVVEREGLLEYYPVERTLDEVADLRGFKAWLAARTAVVRSPGKAREMGLPFPRGVLLLGVPGCGKSMSAKAVSAEWNLPLLRLDPSTLYNKYIGESEQNFRRAMRTAERMAPVVLWVDELEKAFASGGTEDGGVSQRILGSFLSWMQEREGDVFVVATANDVQRLPPEFLRKGRFDEVFFVDLPDRVTREEILRIHLARRGLDPGSFPVQELGEVTTGFSGSELEQAVVSAQYAAFAAGEPLTAGHLRGEIARTRPLSALMGEKVAALRMWAAERTVPAN
ncbi:MAG: AAA family ATPase [Gemmatimonadales bacterium]|nr:MAG: AAA family ATPase [Gemmatimonadales bacterium]